MTVSASKALRPRQAGTRRCPAAVRSPGLRRDRRAGVGVVRPRLVLHAGGGEPLRARGAGSGGGCLGRLAGGARGRLHLHGAVVPERAERSLRPRAHGTLRWPADRGRDNRPRISLDSSFLISRYRPGLDRGGGDDPRARQRAALAPQPGRCRAHRRTRPRRVAGRPRKRLAPPAARRCSPGRARPAPGFPAAVLPRPAIPYGSRAVDLSPAGPEPALRPGQPLGRRAAVTADEQITRHCAG